MAYGVLTIQRLIALSLEKINSVPAQLDRNHAIVGPVGDEDALIALNWQVWQEGLGIAQSPTEDDQAGEHFRPHFGGAWVPSMNRNKRGLALDLRTAGGRDVLMRLVRKADVFMEAFTPGVIDKLGFGWEKLSKENPRLIYASVSGYGQTGPHASRAGYDPCIQAEIGLMDATGPDGGEMCRVGTAAIDYSTGSFCTAGNLANRSKDI